MPDAWKIIDGEPGHRWRNDTGRPAYQLSVAGYNTCAFCWSYDGKIREGGWPLPFHGHCRCRQHIIKPGNFAPAPFIDRREKLLHLAPHEQDAVMGRSLFRLWKRGVIKFEDAVTAAGVLTLAEVVFAHRIPLKTLIAAGIPAAVARKAREDARELRDNPRDRDDELIARLKDATAAHERLSVHLGSAMPAGSAATTAVPLLGGPILPPIARDDDEEEKRRRHAEELRRMLILFGRRKEDEEKAARAERP